MKTREIHVALLLWLLIIKRVKTDGKLDIRFISYWSDGKTSSGHCCDTSCFDNCDPKFTLCIDRYFSPDGRHLCSLYKSTTNYTENKTIINFGSSIQGTANHFIIHVPKAVPSSIHIQVYDYDDSDDHMDTLSKLINISAAATQQEAVYIPYTLWGRTKLEGRNYNQDIDECTEIDNTCPNWGSCTNTLGSFGCICMEGIKDIISITLLGEIDHTDRGDLADGLNRLITELWGIAGIVDVKFMTNTHRENNFTTTYVQLYSALENGSFIESPLLNEIFESNPDEVINQYLPLPLYPPREEANANTKSPHDSWDTNQYVSAILPPVGLVLMSVLLMVSFCIWRRRSSRDDNQLSSFVMDVTYNPQPPRAMTGSLHEASVSPDGYTSLRFFEVEEESHDTSCDATSDTHFGTEDMTLYQDSQQGFGVYAEDNARLGKAATRATHCDDTSNIFLATEDMTLDDVIVHCFRFSPDDNARLGDAASFDRNRDDITKLHLPTEDMTHDQVILHGFSVCPDNKASLGDVATLQQVTEDLDLDPVILRDARASPHDNAGPGDEVATPETQSDETSDSLPTTEDGSLSSVCLQRPSGYKDDKPSLDTRRNVTSYIHPVPRDIILEAAEEDAEYTTIHDNDVEDIVQEDPYETIESLDDNDVENISQKDPYAKINL